MKSGEIKETINLNEHNITSSPQEKLLESLLFRDILAFRELVKHPEVDPSYKYGKPHWSTCLEIASRLKDCAEFTKALLQAGVKPNLNTIIPEPIHYAASKGNDETLRILLLDKRTKINAVDSFGRTALHCAAKNFGQSNDAERYERCIALLISQPNMDVNRPNKKGCTAVYEAAHFGGKEAVVAMLKHGAHILDLDSSRGVGKSARQVIIERYPDLKNILPPLKVEQLQSNAHTQLLAALQHRQLNVFRDLLCQVDTYGNAHLDPNFWYNKPYNSTCLQMACKEHGCEEFVQALLLAGADPNTVNIITKKSPLHITVEAGNHETLHVLLQDKTININMADEYGRTPLHSIVEQHWGNDEDATRFEECLSLLLQQHDIDVNITDAQGNTAIHMAALRGSTKALMLMLKHKGHEFDLDSSPGPDQKTTRKIIMEKFSDIKKLLPQKSIKEDHENVLKETLFQYLYKRKTEEFIETFKNNIKKDIMNSLQEADNGSFTLLQYACNYDLLEVVQVLLEYEANPNATTDYERRPPIVLASIKQNLDIIKCFLELPTNSDFNINATDAKGNTALHYAARNGDLTCVIALLRHGSDIKIRNIFDQTPLPADYVCILLNNSLSTNQHPEDENYEMVFDYSFLVACNKQENSERKTKTEDKLPLVRHEIEEAFAVKQNAEAVTSEMDLLFYLNESQEHRHLLNHPIITSFLQLKWYRIRTTYITNLILFTLFLLLMNIYILMDYGQPSMSKMGLNINSSNENSSSKSEDENQISHLERFRTTYGNIIWLLLLFILFCHTVREMFKFVMSPARYLCKLDNMLNMILVFMTAIVLFNSWENEENKKLFTAFSLFLSWVELALIIGRLPILSINIQMLKSVSKHYLFIFMSYFFIIIAFGVSFYIFYYDNWKSHQSNFSLCQENKTQMPKFTGSSESFQHLSILSNSDEKEKQTLWTSVTHAALYVAGGFSASFISIDHGYGFIMLLLFAFIVIMVMINILTATAVVDVKYIQDNAEQFSIMSRITLLYEIESILIYWNTFMERICKFNCASKMSSYLKSALRKVILFPNIKPTEKRISVLPNKNGKVVFPNEACAIDCKINMKIHKSAINIIGSKGKISDMEQMKHNIEQNHNEGLQKLTECNYTLDKMQNTIYVNNTKIEKLEDDVSKVQSKLDKHHKSLGTNMKNLIEQCQMQLSRVQDNLHDKLNNYEHRFNWLEQSQKQTTDLLLEILNVLNYRYSQEQEEHIIQSEY
ncbi:hypothetical protein L9F63_010977, partial [Diploptera punctata]